MTTKCWKFLELSWNFPLKSCRIGHVEGIFFSVLMLSPPPFTRNHVLRPWKRPTLLTPGGASSRDDCGSPAMHKGPESQEQRLMVNPRDEVTSYCWWTHSCTMLTFVVWWNIPWIYSYVFLSVLLCITYMTHICSINSVFTWFYHFWSINSMSSLIVYPMYPICTILDILSVVIASDIMRCVEANSRHQLGDIKVFILDNSLRIVLHQSIPSYRTEKTMLWDTSISR